MPVSGPRSVWLPLQWVVSIPSCERTGGCRSRVQQCRRLGTQAALRTPEELCVAYDACEVVARRPSRGVLVHALGDTHRSKQIRAGIELPILAV
jgi:hypothetical protein